MILNCYPKFLTQGHCLLEKGPPHCKPRSHKLYWNRATHFGLPELWQHSIQNLQSSWPSASQKIVFKPCTSIWIKPFNLEVWTEQTQAETPFRMLAEKKKRDRKINPLPNPKTEVSENIPNWHTKIIVLLSKQILSAIHSDGDGFVCSCSPLVGQLPQQSAVSEACCAGFACQGQPEVDQGLNGARGFQLDLELDLSFPHRKSQWTGIMGQCHSPLSWNSLGPITQYICRKLTCPGFDFSFFFLYLISH